MAVRKSMIEGLPPNLSDVARHAPHEVTDAINRAVDEVEDQSDEFVAAAARRVLEKTEW